MRSVVGTLKKKCRIHSVSKNSNFLSTSRKSLNHASFQFTSCAPHSWHLPFGNLGFALLESKQCRPCSHSDLRQRIPRSFGLTCFNSSTLSAVKSDTESM